MKLAIITGADGGMGTEITRAVATAGYKIIMACYRPEKAERVRDMLVHDTGNPYIEVSGIDLASLASVAAFAERMLQRGDTVSLLMNNAGTIETGRQENGIVVNAADPGIVSTDIITMHMWFDPLTDILFRPFIRTPRQGAATAVHLLLDEDAGKRTGTLNASCRPKHLSGKYTRHVQMQELWNRTEKIVEKWL